jgi:hypothetical protein
MKLYGLTAMVSSFSSAESPGASAYVKRAANIHGYSPYWHRNFVGSPASHSSAGLRPQYSEKGDNFLQLKLNYIWCGVK